MSRPFSIIYSLLLALTLLVPLAARAKLDPVGWRNISCRNAGLRVNAIAADSLGLLWLGTDRGIYTYDGIFMAAAGLLGTEGYTPCHAICRDGTTLYFGTDHGFFKLRGDSLKPLHPALTDTILSLLPDGDRIWVGTSNGLSFYSKSTGHIDRVEKVNGSVLALIKGPGGFIYPGTNDGFYRVDPEEFTVDKAFLPVERGKSGVVVNAILDDPARECIWLGTESTLFQFMYDGMTLYSIGELDDHNVRSLLLDPAGRLLIGTDQGLYFYTDDWNMPVARADDRNPIAIADNDIRTLRFIGGYLFAGTDKGLSQRLESKDFTEISLRVDSVRADSVILRYLAIKASHEPRQVVWDNASGTLWCGVEGGVMPVYPGIGVGKLYPFAHTDSIAPVKALEVADNRLWLATPGSVFTISITDTVSNRLAFIKEEIVALSLDAATNRLLFESNDNLYAIDHAIELTPRRKVYIRRVSGYDETELFGGIARETPALEVKHDYDSLHIEVTSLDLSPTFTPDYLYRVNYGAWQPFAPGACSVFIKGLRYDDNIVDIACAGSEQYPEDYATLHFSVTRPWHATTLFYVTAMTIFILFLLAAFIQCRRYLRRLKK